MYHLAVLLWVEIQVGLRSSMRRLLFHRRPPRGTGGPSCFRTLREARDVVELKRVMRRGKAPERFCSYTALVSSIADSEPSSFQEAVDQQFWREAMVEEYDSIMWNDVWEVVPRPARFVGWGFSQVEGIDYDKTFPQ